MNPDEAGQNMNPVLECGDPAADNVPAPEGVGYCYAHGFRRIVSAPANPPETIGEPPPPSQTREKLVLTCPHCGQEFEF